MKQNKRLVANIVEIAIGVILSALGYARVIDTYWSGMGTALILAGSLMLIRQVRYRTNPAYKEEVDVQIGDERNKYLRAKAWSWAGYLFVLIAAFASIILKILGYDQYALIASSSVCLIVLLYWVSFWILSRKY